MSEQTNFFCEDCDRSYTETQIAEIGDEWGDGEVHCPECDKVLHDD
jgi:hypothetical protein